MQRSWNHIAWGVAFLALIGGEQCLFAQARGGTSSGSGTLFGSSGALSGANGFSTGTNGVSRGAGMSGSSGTGGLAPSGFGSAFGNNTGRASSQQQWAGMAGIETNLGQTMGNDSARRFVGNSQAGQQQIVGQNRNGQMNQGNRNGANNRGGQNRNGQQDGNQNFMQQGMGGNAAQQQRQVRPQLRLGFEYNAPSASKLEQTLNVRFEKLANRPESKGKFRDVRVAADGTVVTLRGQVATEEDRRLAGIMAGFTPGVRGVQNELTVLTPPPPPEPGAGVE